MRKVRLSGRSLAAALFVLLLLTACGPAEGSTPTLTIEEIQTQAVATFSADLTSTALSMPTDTPTATETPSPTPTATDTPGASNTPLATDAGIIPTGTCYGLAYVSDVTIPDNTTMTPGQQFTKTWRVSNTGTCAWEVGFRLSLTTGEPMGGSAITLTSVVQPGNQTDLSVALTAPSTAGTYRGNWRMSTADGAFFGDEIYVQIVVESAGATPAPSATTEP